MVPEAGRREREEEAGTIKPPGSHLEDVAGGLEVKEAALFERGNVQTLHGALQSGFSPGDISAGIWRSQPRMSALIGFLGSVHINILKQFA